MCFSLPLSFYFYIKLGAAKPKKRMADCNYSIVSKSHLMDNTQKLIRSSFTLITDRQLHQLIDRSIDITLSALNINAFSSISIQMFIKNH